MRLVARMHDNMSEYEMKKEPVQKLRFAALLRLTIATDIRRMKVK